MRRSLALATFVLACRKPEALAQPDASRVLSDEDLVRLSRAAISRSEVNAFDQVVGRYRGSPVRVTVRCTAGCPEQAVRLVRYDVPLASCATVGGLLVKRAIPRDGGVSFEEHCVPRLLADDIPVRYR